jgi:hypothetical protein
VRQSSCHIADHRAIGKSPLDRSRLIGFDNFT